MNKCEICGYYEDLIAWHYEECPKLKEKYHRFKFSCEWCHKEMTEEDHHFCDICGDCREENEEDWDYE
tara:strand:+ start:129 stop:332 length:204 start_codon:yes stop_codon:yes gene_type:complete